MQDHDPGSVRELKPIRLPLLSGALNEFKRAGFYKIYCTAKDNNNYPYYYFHIGQVESVGPKSNQTEVDKVNYLSECDSIEQVREAAGAKQG